MMLLKSLLLIVLCRTTGAASSTIYWVHGLNMSVGIDSDDGTLTKINATNTGFSRSVVGRSFITDDASHAMQQLSIKVDRQSLHNAVTVTRLCRVQGYGTIANQSFEVQVVDSFKASADPTVGGIEWTLTTTGRGTQPWRAAVGTELRIVSSARTHAISDEANVGSISSLDYWLPQNGAGMYEDVLAMRNARGNGSAAAAYTNVELGCNYIKSSSVTYKCAPGSMHMPYPLFLWASSTGADADPVDGGGGIIVAPRLNDSTIGATADLNSTHLLYKRLFNRQQSAPPSASPPASLSGASSSISWTTHLGSLNPPCSAAVSPALPPSVRQDDPWRDALRFEMAVNPAVFTAVQPAANPATGQPTSLANVGLGIYTCAPAASINISTTVDYAGATTLWDASFWWPYMGMFLPPVANLSALWTTNLGASEQATCSKPGSTPFKHGQQASASTVANHLHQMTEVGITNPLSYFNLFEFGQNVKWPLPPPTPGCTFARTVASSPASPELLPAECWNDSSVMLASSGLGKAVMYSSAAAKSPTSSWQGAIVMDPGVQIYHDFLVEQAARHFTLLGTDFHGIAIDRTDWTSRYGRNRDDGKTWCGEPCSSMLLAWLKAAESVSAVIHNTTRGHVPTPPGREPLILVNYAGSARIELLTHADGIFSEDGDTMLNSIGLSTLAMPAIGWTYPGKRNKHLNDAYMQTHLRMGVAPTAPVYASDHSLADGDPAVNALFKDYGSLFTMIRGVRWGFDRSHVVRVEPPPSQGGPLHNVFEAMDPRAAPVPWTVVLALADDSVDSVLITLKLPFGNQPAGCVVQLPGVQLVGEPAVIISQEQVGQDVLIQLQARLLRGCAVLQCSLE